MEYEKIQEQFDRVISYSQGIPMPRTDKLFQEWKDAKSRFIKAFGDKLIYEVPVKVHFSLDDNEKKNRLNEFIDIVDSTFDNGRLASFLDDNVDSFFNNTVSVEYDRYGIKIPKGMKLIKAFKFFEEDKNTLEIIQNRASQVIQEDKIEGTLCFSVHPLDFLSVSENTYNWRSCHALDGEYRAGNLSYMVDSTTFICYLKGEDNINIPMFPDDVKWNSKKWRVLLYKSDTEDMIFAGRQYPFASQSGLERALSYLNHIFSDNPFNTFSPWKNYYILPEDTDFQIDNSYLPIKGKLEKLEDIVQDGKGALQFNDLLRSSTYLRPSYTQKEIGFFGRHQANNAKPFFSIGAEVFCLECEKNPITNAETMRCDDCELAFGYEENDTYCTCDCCGSRMLREEGTVVNDADYVCLDCFRKECFVCNECDEIKYNSEIMYDKEYGDYTCKSCYNKRRRK